MSGISLQIDLNDGHWQQLFQRLAQADRTALLTEIGEHQLAETLLNFDAERSPEGDAWEKSQRAVEQGGQTLQDRGHLRDSYSYQVNGNQVEIGSNMVYAAIHHAGGEAGRNKSVTLPARTALGFTAENERDIEAIGTDYLRRVLQ